MTTKGDGERSGPDPRLVNCGIKDRGKAEEWVRWLKNEPTVIGCRIHKNDVEIVRSVRDGDALAERLNGSRRGEIRELSKSSRRRLALTAANTLHPLKSFITLTYPRDYPSDGKTVKGHFKRFLNSLRAFAPEPLHYLWFLEFQRRGAPHFHIFLSAELPDPRTTLRRRLRPRPAVVFAPWQEWVSRRWFEIVDSGDEKHLAAGACWEAVHKADGAARYVAKEAWKCFQKDVPDDYRSVGRFWGTSRGFLPEPPPLVRASATTLRRYLGDGAAGTSGEMFPVVFGAAETLRDRLPSRKK